MSSSGGRLLIPRRWIVRFRFYIRSHYNRYMLSRIIVIWPNLDESLELAESSTVDPQRAKRKGISLRDRAIYIRRQYLGWNL
jgi:hypothetical protein